MTRFAAITTVFALVAGVVALGATGALRWWGLACVLAGYGTVTGLGVAFIRLRLFVDAICRGKRGGGRIALTFDDGPDPAATPALLGLLEEQGVKATFFCIGEKVLSEPDLARRVVDEGHLMANHSHRHAWWTNFLPGRAILEEITRAQEAIAAATGMHPAYYRPPVGLTNPSLSPALKRAGLTCVGWDVRGLDRNPDCPETVIRRVLKRAVDGSIILLHDGGADPATLVSIVTAVIVQLHDRGYTLVRLDELLGARDELDCS